MAWIDRSLISISWHDTLDVNLTTYLVKSSTYDCVVYSGVSLHKRNWLAMDYDKWYKSSLSKSYKSQFRPAALLFTNKTDSEPSISN